MWFKSSANGSEQIEQLDKKKWRKMEAFQVNV